MESKIVQSLVKKTGIPNLIEILSEQLSSGELQSLLLSVFEKQAARHTPAQLLRNYQENRFVKPSALATLQLLNFDQLAFQIASEFEAIQLSPLSPLGTCSTLGTVHQNKVVSALRNTEVLADATNAMGLEAAMRRKKLLKENPKSSQSVKLCASHRLVRGQALVDPSHTAHFQIFSMVSAGRDQGSFQFELQQLYEHLNFYLDLLQQVTQIDLHPKAVKAGVTILNPLIDSDVVQTKLFKPLSSAYSGVHFYINDARQRGRGYYQTFCFNIDATSKEGFEINLVDGGCTDWTQLLLQNKKERLIISGIGSELLLKLFVSCSFLY